MIKISFIIFILFNCFGISTSAKETETQYAYFHIVDINHPTPLEEIQRKYRTIFPNNENINNSLVFETEYSEFSCIVKKYELHITLSSSFQEIHQLDYIWVIDFEAPQIELDIDKLEHNLDTPLQKDDITKHIKFIDNYDQEASEFILNDFDALTEAGDYQLLIYALDSSGNLSNKIYLPIHLTKTIFDYYIPNEIVLTNLKSTPEEIITMFLKENEIDSNYESISTQSNFFSAKKAGIYTITFTIKYPNRTDIYHGKLNIKIENQNKQKNTITTLITLGVLSVLILILYVIYRKRKSV